MKFKPFSHTIIGIITFIVIAFATSNQYEVIGQFNEYTLIQRKGDILMYPYRYYNPPIGSYQRLYFDWDWTYKHSPKLNDLIK